MSNRQKRKKRQRASAAATPDTPQPPSRSEQKNIEARAALVPLEPGERPTAVTVGAIVAALLGLSNVVSTSPGVEIRRRAAADRRRARFQRADADGAWGMWKVRYWAVLGMQTLLGLMIVILSLVRW